MIDYIVMNINEFEEFARHHTKESAINKAISMCEATDSIIYVVKNVADVSPRGTTVVDYEEEETDAKDSSD